MSGEGAEITAAGTVDEEQEIQEILSKVDSTTFNEDDDWNIVVIETESLASSWEKLVVYLGLPFDLIDNTIRPASNCWSEALKQWIKQNYNTKKFGQPSWRTLLRAVAQVNKLQFKKLAEKHKAVGAHSPPATVEEPVASATKQEVTDNAQLSTTERVEDVRRVESNTTSVAPVKSKFTFPYLRFQHLSEAAEQRLRQKLYAESEDMMYKFQNLFTSTKKSFCARQVAIKDLAQHLKGLGQLKPTFKDTGELPLRHRLVELEKKESVDDAMSIVFDYCSFFNYRMLEHIINELGDEEDKANLARYKEDFARYGKRHIFECPAVVGEMSEEGQANMFVTLDDSFDNCNVNHLYAFVSNLEKVLRMDNVSLRLCRIAPGSLKLIFQLPLSVQREIFPLSCDQESALAGLGVIDLSCGDYQFHTQEKMETEDPASDDDSGHTDSEGGVDSMDIVSRDAELASLAGRLIAEKPGGSLFADSALGRSTAAASVTTAGVTHLSENLFDMGMGHGGTGTLNKLHLASYEGDLEEVKRLIEEQGFNPLQTVGENEWNALHATALGGHTTVIKHFIQERGCNPACQDSTGFTPLHYAAQYGHLELVWYLIDEEKVDPMCLTKDDNTPLHLACAGGNIDVVTYIVNAMTKYLPLKDVVEFKGQKGYPPMHVAVQYGHLELVKFFITELNCDPLITDDYGQIALHHAAFGGHLHIVRYFIEQFKCNPAHTDKNKFTPLHFAAGKGHIETVNYLTLEQHCDPTCTDKDNLTPLHWAAFLGRLEVVMFFIESLHCPADVRTLGNNTPLMFARLRGHHNIVKYLESITK